MEPLGANRSLAAQSDIEVPLAPASVQNPSILEDDHSSTTQT